MSILKAKMNKIKLVLIIIIFAVIGLGIITYLNSDTANKVVNTITSNLNQDEDKGGPGEQEPHPLSIEALRKGEYPGSNITIEQTLAPGSNYQRYIASYKSEGLKIYALLTVPNDEKPKTGWPVVIFNHGYIPPNQYVTTERYIAYTDAFSRNGYIVFRSDYRGHGNSEGQGSSYGSNGYTVDILNAVADHSVPLEFSEKLNEELKAAGKISELYTYPSDDHNISNNLSLALQRSVDFFDKYVKGGEL